MLRIPFKGYDRLLELRHKTAENPSPPASISTRPTDRETLQTLTHSQTLSDRLKTLIVIPAFNEERNIGRVLEGIRLYVSDIAILVINDGSGDRTAQVAEAHGAQVISLPYNSGYGVALQTGFIYALKNDYSIVIQMDADGQHDPRFVTNLLREVQRDDVDVVIGSRFITQNNYQISWVRRTGMWIFSQLASLICGQRVSDPTSGFQAVKGKAISFVAGEFFPPDYPDADFLIMLHRNGFKMREIPVTMHANPDNRSMHRGHRTIYYVFKMFLSIFVTLLRQKPRR